MILGLERMVRDMARRLARGMGSFFKDCDCARTTRRPHPYSIRFRDAPGKQREESGYGTQDDAIRAQSVPLTPDPMFTMRRDGAKDQVQHSFVSVSSKSALARPT